MMKLTMALTLALAVIGFVAPATAHTTSYSATMSGPAESPPNDSLGTGYTLIDINDHDFTMRIRADFSGLTGNVTIAHIHCCTSVAETGTAGVASPLPSFPGFPAGGKSGSYDQTFDLTLLSSWNAAFVNANGGTTGSAFATLMTALEDGKAYLNIHTTYRSGGEIRGFYAPVPVPAALWLFAPAALGLAGLRRRARIAH